MMNPQKIKLDSDFLSSSPKSPSSFTFTVIWDWGRGGHVPIPFPETFSVVNIIVSGPLTHSFSYGHYPLDEYEECYRTYEN